MTFHIDPIGHVESVRDGLEDDYWGGEEACIALDARFGADALRGLEAFSHVEVLFLFDRVTGARHPRGNPDWPEVGISCRAASCASPPGRGS